MGLLWLEVQFLQPSHLQSSEHANPCSKHSQYFFKQPDFVQLQPLKCLLGSAMSISFWLLVYYSTILLWAMVSSSDKQLSLRQLRAFFDLNANGFLTSICSMAFKRLTSALELLLQHEHRQCSEQYRLFLKHSQYSFKHPEFVQLHNLGYSSSAVWGDTNELVGVSMVFKIWRARAVFSKVLWCFLLWLWEQELSEFKSDWRLLHFLVL